MLAWQQLAWLCPGLMTQSWSTWKVPCIQAIAKGVHTLLIKLMPTNKSVFCTIPDFFFFFSGVSFRRPALAHQNYRSEQGSCSSNYVEFMAEKPNCHKGATKVMYLFHSSKNWCVNQASCSFMLKVYVVDCDHLQNCILCTNICVVVQHTYCVNKWPHIFSDIHLPVCNY